VVLALFGAILVSFVAAATAFAVMDKTVRLVVDGRPVAVQTFAGTVAGVLRKAGLDLGPHDTVAPDLSAPVGDGSDVIVRHGRLLHLTLDGEQRDVWVTALSVDEALADLGLADRGAWLSASRSQEIPRSGLSLELRIPQHVTVLVDGHRKTRTTTAPTVRALLRDLHVRLHRLDRVSVPLERYPTDGLVVTVDRITRRLVTNDVAIPFNTRHVRDASMYVGDSKLLQPGRPGLRVLTYRITRKNHRIVKRELVRSKVRRHPVARVVAVGTRARPQYAPAADGLNWPALAQCESGGNPRLVDGPYHGLYQFTLSTWQSVGGSGDPIDASPDEQTYRAQLLYRRSGDSPWPVCGHYLYT
jgi:uncharacterized protein YabE (DUF348 family)